MQVFARRLLLLLALIRVVDNVLLPLDLLAQVVHFLLVQLGQGALVFCSLLLRQVAPPQLPLHPRHHLLMHRVIHQPIPPHQQRLPHILCISIGLGRRLPALDMLARLHLRV